MTGKSVAAPTEVPSITQGFASDSITPYQLLKNPFLKQGKLVRLDFIRFPIILNDAVVNYGQCSATPVMCQQLGSVGLRFNRMMEANEALYDVMGEDVNNGVNVTKQGEILVEIMQSEDQPPLAKDWIVITNEPMRGTNGFGAAITIPSVKFVRTASENDAPRVLSPR
jgi:hypothetical protein